jgi:creatinine amidohydrolase
MSLKYAYEYSWDEIESLIQSWKTISVQGIVVIPLGAIRKEHGWHLPLGTDAYQANYYAERLLKEYCPSHENILIDSTLTINYFPAFTEYPGTMCLSFQTSCLLCEELCEQWIGHGIENIYFLNMGISTNRVLTAIKEKLEKKYENDRKTENLKKIRISFTNLKTFDAKPEISSKILENGTHAGQSETSTMLYLESIGYLKKGLIKMNRAIDEDNEERNPSAPNGLSRNPNATSGVYSESGTWGNATLATVEVGEFLTNEMYSFICQDLDRFFL